MRDFMTLGPVPFEEECIQVSPEVDYTEMRNEDTDSQTFAFFVESNLPARWSDDAKLDWSAEYVTAGE
jgi:hypothetical protein